MELRPSRRCTGLVHSAHKNAKRERETTGGTFRMQPYLVGVDIGGTFTDCVVIDRDGRVTTAKAPSTPGNFADGMLDALRGAAGQLGIALDDLCRNTAVLSHGTTVGTNAL